MYKTVVVIMQHMINAHNLLEMGTIFDVRREIKGKFSLLTFKCPFITSLVDDLSLTLR